MTPSPMAEAALRSEVTAFLDHARSLSARGDIDSALALYDFPLFLTYDDASEIITNRDGLLRHLEKLAKLRATDNSTIWYQDVKKVSVLTRKLVNVVAEVQRLDQRGKPLRGLLQTLILRRGPDGFRFASIINPIRRGYWKEDMGVVQ